MLALALRALGPRPLGLMATAHMARGRRRLGSRRKNGGAARSVCRSRAAGKGWLTQNLPSAGALACLRADDAVVRVQEIVPRRFLRSESQRSHLRWRERNIKLLAGHLPTIQQMIDL